MAAFFMEPSMTQFDPKERYKKLDEDTDSFLENLKRSKWTPLILLGLVTAVVLLAFMLT